MRQRHGLLEERMFSVQHGHDRLVGRQEPAWSMVEEDEAETLASPIFLVGSIRSGTTLLRLMLDHHPELAFFHEFPYAVEMMPDAGWPDLADYYQKLSVNRIFQDSQLAIDTRLDYPQLMNSFLRQKRDRDQKRQVGATVHIKFDRLLRIWPDARFIHIIRDGRDVARSLVDLGWAGNVYMGVQTWIKAERLWEEVRQGVPASSRMELKYEELVNDAEGQLTRICQFLDLAYDPAMLRYDEDSTYSAPDPRLIGQWRRKLDAKSVRLIEGQIAGMLLDRGYELSGNEPIEAGPVRQRLLRFDDRRNRLATRHRLYGTPLFAAELLMKSLEPAYQALAQFRTDVRQKINDVERTTLK